MSLLNSHKYDDIINLPHHVSQNHPPMELIDRAAQFSPFAALSGFEEAIEETQQIVQAQAELLETVSEDERMENGYEI